MVPVLPQRTMFPRTPCSKAVAALASASVAAAVAMMVTFLGAIFVRRNILLLGDAFVQSLLSHEQQFLTYTTLCVLYIYIYSKVG